MSVCSLKDVTKVYRTGFTRRRLVALQQVSLTVEAGETFAYLGHNGAGKSTTIKALLGLVRIDGGEVTLFGAPTGDPRPRAQVGYLPENPYFYDHLTGREILQLAADLHGLGRSLARQRIGDVLELVDMSAAARHRLRTYSKGMLQRIGLAQALINDPDLLILDEPMSGLDPVGRHQIRTILTELRQRGKTLFMSSHILYDVEAIADRAAILSHGCLRRVVDLADLPSTSRRLEVQCRGLQEAALAALRSRGLRVDRDGYVTRIEVGEEAQIPAILTAVRDGGAQLLGVIPQRQSLEEIFLAEVKSPDRPLPAPPAASPRRRPAATPPAESTPVPVARDAERVPVGRE